MLRDLSKIHSPEKSAIFCEYVIKDEITRHIIVNKEYAQMTFVLNTDFFMFEGFDRFENGNSPKISVGGSLT